MAKLEATLHGNFSAILNAIDTAVLEGSFTASLEDESHFQSSSGRCVLRVYERYSALGGNRVSLSVLLLETAHGVRLSAIASGGSQAMFLQAQHLRRGGIPGVHLRSRRPVSITPKRSLQKCRLLLPTGRYGVT